jgi:hypothetical protein
VTALWLARPATVSIIGVAIAIVGGSMLRFRK